MCIKLHLEEQVGYINEKQINVNELYNLKKNCYGLKKKIASLDMNWVIMLIILVL